MADAAVAVGISKSMVISSAFKLARVISRMPLATKEASVTTEWC